MIESKKNYSVLIVEDEPIIVRILESILKDSSYRIDEPVNTGTKAISRVVSHRPGIVLMDIDLPGPISGIDTARILLHIFSIPVIFVTGHDEEAVLLRAKDADPYGFLVKPINQNILDITIQVAVRLHEKISSTAEGKICGLTPDQRKDLVSSVKPVVLLDDRRRIIWINDEAECIIGHPVTDLIFTDVSDFLIMHDPVTGEQPVIISPGRIHDGPLVFPGEIHNRQVISRLFLIHDPFGEIGGFFLEFTLIGE